MLMISWHTLPFAGAFVVALISSNFLWAWMGTHDWKRAREHACVQLIALAGFMLSVWLYTWIRGM